MALQTKFDPISRDLDVAIKAWIGPERRAEILAEKAKVLLTETDQRNARALGRPVGFETFVDGARTEAIDSVRADGVITRTYEVMPLVLMEIGALLWRFSPVATGNYQQHHVLLADGSEIARVREGWTLPSLPRGAREFAFVSLVPYARPIEHGSSKKAPDGVYEVVATMARQSYVKLAKVKFEYRPIVGVQESRREQERRVKTRNRDLRQPAIVIQEK